jgi:hypothetical protein
VGVVLGLQSQRLGHLFIHSLSQGWSAGIYLADQTAPTLAGWGQPVAVASAIAGDTVVDLGRRRGTAVLVWITDLGEGNAKVTIGELQLRP